MKAVGFHSHCNGWEYMKVNRPAIWADIQAAVAAVAPVSCTAETPDNGAGHRRSGCRIRQLNRLFRAELSRRGWTGVGACGQMELMKERVGIRLQFGRRACISPGLPANLMALYMGDLTDVGVEILPMKELQEQMSSGVPYYEGALYDLLRQGRNTPAVPLVLIGVTA